jgi:hypothetical protein
MTELEALSQAMAWADHFMQSNMVTIQRINCKKRKTQQDRLSLVMHDEAIARQHKVKDTLQRIYNKLQLDA